MQETGGEPARQARPRVRERGLGQKHGAQRNSSRDPTGDTALRPALPALAALTLLAAPARAHDVWLQPRGWQVAPGAALPVTVEIGHGPFRQRWGVQADHVAYLSSFGPEGTTDRRAEFRPSSDDPNLSPSFARAGLHVLVLNSTDAFSDLPSIRFNDYLVAEGLTPAIDARARARTTGENGRELYRRRCKALIQVGSSNAADARLATRPLGLSLEIVPLTNPYALGPDRQLPVQILYEGKPLPGALVMLTSLEFDTKPIATARTDTRGQTSFRVPPVGSWLVNVLWTKPIRNPKADFETTFSSLTFGYAAAARPR